MKKGKIYIGEYFYKGKKDHYEIELMNRGVFCIYRPGFMEWVIKKVKELDSLNQPLPDKEVLKRMIPPREDDDKMIQEGLKGLFKTYKWFQNPFRAQFLCWCKIFNPRNIQYIPAGKNFTTP